MEMKTISEVLGEHVESITYKNLSSQVKKKTKELLLDWIGCAVYGSRNKNMKFLTEKFSGEGESTLIGLWNKTNPLSAAFLNSFSSHSTELDDVHMGGIIHPGTVVNSAALALAEEQKKSGKELIEAIVAGYEVCIRVAVAAGQEHYKIWHTTGTCGSFGAAASASKIQKLDSKETAEAIGIAGVLTSGLWEYIKSGSSLKPLIPAHASWLGALASMLSLKRIASPLTIFEGSQGFMAGLAPNASPKKIIENLEAKEILNVSIKPYPSCRHIHSSIEAALKMHKKVEVNKVRKVEVETYREAVEVAGLRKPVTIEEAKFSLSHCVAAALVNGSFTVKDLRSSLKDKEVLKLRDKVIVKVREEFNNLLPKQPSLLRIEKESGEVLEEFVDKPKGDPENPLTINELKEKFISLVEGNIGEERSKTLFKKIMEIDSEKEISIFEYI